VAMGQSWVTAPEATGAIAATEAIVAIGGHIAAIGIVVAAWEYTSMVATMTTATVTATAVGSVGKPYEPVAPIGGVATTTASTE